MTDPMFC